MKAQTAAGESAPLDAPYTLVLTHDVDHLSMRGLPFLSRAQLALVKALVFGNLRRVFRGRLELRDYVSSLALALKLPLVALGLCRDPWERSIEVVTQLEDRYGVRSTFFFMPFDRQPGHVQPGISASQNRASYYRVSNHADLIRSLTARGWEVGIHGIDCHVSAAAAAAERAELAAIVGQDYRIGVRMHWLYSSPELRRNLAEADYAYDATLGWNDRIGFPRADEEPGNRGQSPNGDSPLPGSSPAFRPFKDAETGLDILPLNIQDVALLRADHMDLGPEQAWKSIKAVLDEARAHQAVVTVLWHNDSLLPPRCWAGLYRRILEQARSDGAVVERAIDAVSEETSAAPCAVTHRRTGETKAEEKLEYCWNH